MSCATISGILEVHTMGDKYSKSHDPTSFELIFALVSHQVLTTNIIISVHIQDKILGEELMHMNY